MSLRNKLIVQYVRQFFGFVLVLLLCLTISMLILGTRVTNEQIASDLSGLSTTDIEARMIYGGENVGVNEEIQRSVESHNGWLQILGKYGDVVYSYRTPPEFTGNQAPGVRIEQSQPSLDFPYRVKFWVVESRGEKLIVYYGTPSPGTRLLKLLVTTSMPEGGWKEKKDIQTAFSREKAWFAVYDRDGQLVEELNQPEVSRRLDLAEVLENDFILSHFDQTSRLTYVVGVPPSPDPAMGDADSSINDIVAYALRQLLLVLLLCILVAGIWYALRVGQPLLHMVNWLEQLAKGHYEEPVNRKGKKVGTTRSGKRKKSFAVYKDMFDSLQHLTTTLRMNQQRQRDVERTREEWITGLSHDLKTPLSSIFGYASILDSSPYEWGQREIREFGKTIREKAEYMDDLIEDLNLTYRLKNHALSMVKEPVEVVETIRRITVDMVNDPSAADHVIEFQTDTRTLTTEVDPKWFRRIMVNILANAIKHTPANTKVIVSIASRQDGGFVIEVKDNGPGMNEETKENLFERYYRGGHTQEDVSGTGLGMAIAKQLVLAHEGEIEVRSEFGSGTAVSVMFPGQKSLT
ncbi:HAMP domain-containing sensor histidine kinase [Brevibacillus choshinensis]|uniref:sensor histidine kinase n=1 Tax=Brevibacillus choshinensis TaxID=54911 RepID=UPI002E1C3D34|nr:HAMP domain-containing sensor histidine kinase [Brevibacillus choshinensis]